MLLYRYCGDVCTEELWELENSTHCGGFQVEAECPAQHCEWEGGCVPLRLCRLGCEDRQGSVVALSSKYFTSMYLVLGSMDPGM